MDRVSIRKLAGIVTLSCGSLVLPPVAEGGLFDWLFHRNRAPAVTAPVTTANYGGQCGAAYCEQTVLRYVPQVAYRTVWQPVPVTTYRRTVSYNPQTGLPMTCTQPCTTYTYQARRVPYTSYRPVYTTEPVAPTPIAPTTTYPVAAVNYGGVAPAAYAAPNGSCGCNGAAPAAWQAPGTGQPYYTTPDTANPAGATPWESVNGSGAPAAMPAQPATPLPPGGDPASQRPRIAPEIQPQAAEGTSYRLPSVQRQYAAAPADARTPEFRGSRLNDFYRQEATNTPSEWTTVRPNFDSPQPAPAAAPAPTTADTVAPLAEQSFDSRRSAAPLPSNVRPLPNLEAPTNSTNHQESSAPPLLNEPRDQTASLVRPIPTRWAANRIAWPERQVSFAQPIEADTDTSSPESAAWRSQRSGARRLDVQKFEQRQVESSPSATRRSDAQRASLPPADLESGWRSQRGGTW